MLLAKELRNEFARELEHWKAAIERLADLDTVASPQAWQALEHYLGVSLRQSLASIVGRARRIAQDFDVYLRTASPDTKVEQLQGRLVELRQAYLRAETAVDFYSDALASRSAPRMAALLRACDHIATRSMAEALAPMGREVPAALTYIDKGLGASILKAGLRLWDGTAENPVATIKITRHNSLRPSAIIHEAGHQVAHMLGWTPELANALASSLGSPSLGVHWGAWASEIAADAFAHVHTGYAAAAALHDVLDGSDETVFQYLPGDPHPISFLRVLLALEMCRRTFGAGAWDQLAITWTAKHRLERSPADIRNVLRDSVRAMPQIVETILYKPYRAFGGRPLTSLIDPRRVSPTALAQLERAAGAAAFTSPYWAWNEAIRLMALNGYGAGLGAQELRTGVKQQEDWMLRLGALRSAA
jgi:hypothetical protein